MIYDMEIHNQQGEYRPLFSPKAQALLNNPPEAFEDLRQMQEFRLWSAVEGLTCSSYTERRTFEELLEDLQCFLCIGLIKQYHPTKLTLVTDDPVKTFMNLDWSPDRPAFEAAYQEFGDVWSN